MVESSSVGVAVASSASPGAATPAEHICVTLGWVGAQDRHLSKYAALMHELGVRDVARATLPTSDAFLFPSARRAMAADVLAMLQGQALPAYLYYFSNGGAFMHEPLLELLAEDRRREPAQRRYAGVRISGAIFDSAPAFVTPRSAALALSSTLQSALAQKLVFTVAHAFFGASNRLHDSSRFFDSLATCTLPTLYIYSQTDVITDSERVTALADQRAARGCRISRLYFPKEMAVPHVSGLRNAPAAYREALAAFFRSTATAEAAASTAEAAAFNTPPPKVS